jgi:hypothetical protein
MASTPEVRLSAADIRTRFNAGKYAERAADDTDVSVCVSQELDIGPAPTWAPKGARSRIIKYADQNGLVVAIAHQYGYPDGRPIRNTKPDPKFLFEGGTRYKLDPRLNAPKTAP